MDEGMPGGGLAAVPGRWRFGTTVLDERTATLSVAGRQVDLDRSSYDILLALLRHAGEVVTKDELLEAGWPGRIVSENSLAKAVGRIRRALGPEAAGLRSVHGYGYRLAVHLDYEPMAPERVEAHPLDSHRLRPGDRLPHRPGWSLLRRLGEGSSGVIFLAESPGSAPRAVKFATSEHGLRSLKREIALARYIDAVGARHPAIAPVVDWNLSQPPFFLELPYYPHGNLRQWAQAPAGLAALDAGDRLQLCIRLCEAVATLHAVGIIHKDLKPENLYPMPRERGAGGGWEAVLADFGSSDAVLAPQLAELGITLSIVDPARGGASPQGATLLYIAPEVVAGEAPTQRSDVFALGVLVYQVMVGDLWRSLAPGWEADIGDPVLREDISLAAAAKPDLREVDARGLANRLRTLDVRRAARDADQARAEEARRQSIELRRLRSRRRQLATATLMLVAFLGVSLWQQGQAGRLRAEAQRLALRAEAEAAKTRGVVEFLTDGVLRRADPFAGGSGEVTLQQAIDGAAGEVDARFAGQPEIAAAVHGTLGASYEGLNRFDEAVRHYRRQVDLLRAAPAMDLAGVARAQASLCTAWHWQGDMAQVVPACERARADHLAADLVPDRPEVYLALADSRRDRNREALARLEPRLPRLRDGPDRDLHGDALWFAGNAHLRLGHVVEGERRFAELVDVRTRQRRGDSMQLAWALSDHGRAQLLVGGTDAGKASLARAEAIFGRIAGEQHPHAWIPRVHLGSHALLVGEWEEARRLSGAAYEALHAASGWQNWTVYAALGAMQAEAELGNAADARAIIAAFDAMADQGLARDFPYLREPWWTAYVATYLALGDAATAAAWLDRLEGLAAEPGAGPLVQARVHCFRGRLAVLQGAVAAGRVDAGRCRERMAQLLPAASPMLAQARRVLAQTASAVAGGP